MNAVGKLLTAFGALPTRLTAKVQPLANSLKPRLNTFLHYAKHELKPPMPNEIPTILREVKHFNRTFNMNSMTMRELAIYTGVCVEILCWFFIGEVLGRRHLLGYYVAPKFPPIHMERFHDWKEPVVKKD